MAYITMSNSKKIVRTLSEMTLYEMETVIYKKEIYFFNKKEKAMLKGMREFIRDPENFSVQYYTPLEILDSLRYVYPESQPAYHNDNTCPRLQSNFINFEIPPEIRERGMESIKRFRSWFLVNKHLLESDLNKFIESMQAQFFITREINPRSIDWANSGTEKKENYSVAVLEYEIDEILREAGSFFRNNSDKQEIIRRFGKLTFLAYVHGDIYTNDSGLNDDELKEFLSMYDLKFKKPVKGKLLDYYRLLYNPDMTFNDTLLHKLGFRPCGTCIKHETDELNSADTNYEDLKSVATIEHGYDPTIDTIEPDYDGV